MKGNEASTVNLPQLVRALANPSPSDPAGPMTWPQQIAAVEILSLSLNVVEHLLLYPSDAAGRAQVMPYLETQRQLVSVLRQQVTGTSATPLVN